MKNRKSACAILCLIPLLLAGCVFVLPFTPDDSETLATNEGEMVVGMTTRESVLERLGRPDAIYDLGPLTAHTGNSWNPSSRPEECNHYGPAS